MGGWSIFPRKSDRKTGRIVRACFAELFGTFSVVFWGAGAAMHVDVTMTTLHLAFGFGIGTAVAAYIFQDISGSHFNPAVSFALFIAQRISLVRCLLYWMMQFGGAALASALLWVFNSTIPGTVMLREQAVTAAGLIPATSQWQGFLLELIGTMALVYTYLAATNRFRNMAETSYTYPVALGCVVFLVHLLMVPLTGCGLNPARAILVNALAGKLEQECWVYVVGPLIASFLGAFSYELIFSFPLIFTPRNKQAELDAGDIKLEPVVKSTKNPKHDDLVLSNRLNGSVAYD